MSRILLIRHGLTDSTGKYLSGRSSGLFLNEKGRQQVQRLAERLKDLPIAAIYCSPLERAVQTATPLADLLHLPCIISGDFQEINFGEWTNKSVEEMRDDPLFKQFNTFRSSTRIPGGELASETQQRVISGIEKLHEVHPEQTVAVFSHADPIRTAIAYYAGIPIDLYMRIEISPASVSILERFNNTARIVLLNAMSHEL